MKVVIGRAWANGATPPIAKPECSRTKSGVSVTVTDTPCASDGPRFRLVAVKVTGELIGVAIAVVIRWLPLDLGAPIAGAWDTTGVLPDGTEMKDRAELAPPGYVATLFAKVEPEAASSSWVRGREVRWRSEYLGGETSALKFSETRAKKPC